MSEIKNGDFISIVVKVIESESDYGGMVVTPENVFEDEQQYMDEAFFIMPQRILGKVEFNDLGWRLVDV